MKEGPHLQGLPFFSAPSSPLSPLAVPFSPLNYGCEGRRRRDGRRERGGGISHSQIKRKGVKKGGGLGKGRDRQQENTSEKSEVGYSKRGQKEEWKKENLNEWFLSFHCDPPLLLVHCGSAGAFSPLGSFHQVPLFLHLLHWCPLSRPLQHAHTDTQTHPLLISKQAEPMKVNNCPLSWKCPLSLRWSGVGVCIQSKHHHSQIPTCGDLECSAARLKKKKNLLLLSLWSVLA